MTVRQARPEDEPKLRDIDAATWTAGVSPAPPPSADAAFLLAACGRLAMSITMGYMLILTL
jgi:hypothetical protein